MVTLHITINSKTKQLPSTSGPDLELPEAARRRAYIYARM
jgi:hypothetical protein